MLPIVMRFSRDHGLPASRSPRAAPDSHLPIDAFFTEAAVPFRTASKPHLMDIFPFL
jgi:hypothetical protein